MKTAAELLESGRLVSSTVLRIHSNIARAGRVSSWPQSFFQPSQTEISRQGQDRRGNGSGQNELIVHHGETAKDELAQASCANRGGNGGQSHRNDDCDSYAGENHARRQR